MPLFKADELRRITTDVFIAANTPRPHARIVAEALVEANLVGHDSHGVIRIPQYLGYLRDDWIDPAATIRVEHQTPTLAVVNGNWGFGQVVGRQAMELGIDKARGSGLAAVALSRSNHLGRVGDYTMMAARQDMISIAFVNGHGAANPVAPWGGIERRLSTNPIAAAIPRGDGEPIVVDVCTAALAEGKLRVMRNRGEPVPAGCIIDSVGRPTTDANDFYGPPPGAVLPFGSHKGYGLSILTDILAGVLSGAGCSRGADRIANGMLAIVIDPASFRPQHDFGQEIGRFVQYLKSSARAEGVDEILVPGEPEARVSQQRAKEGIDVDPETWAHIREAAADFGVSLPG